MFQLYKYKRISVFLLTFFVLANGFSSYYRDDEVDKFIARQRHNSVSPVRPLFPTIDTYKPSTYTYPDYSIDDPSESCKEKVNNNFILKNNIEQIKNAKEKSSKLNKDNKEESQKNKINIQEDLHDDLNSSEDSEFWEDIDDKNFINDFITEANDFINNANDFINKNKKKRKNDLIDSEEKSSEFEEKSIKKKSSKKIKTLPKKPLKRLAKDEKRIPKKNKSSRKRKSSIKELSETEEEENEESWDENFTPGSVRQVFPIFEKPKTAKYIVWTDKMKERLKELKSKKNPNTGKNYTHEEIAVILNDEFLDNRFTKEKVSHKWLKIGGDEIKKRNEVTKWTAEMEERLRVLKSKKNPNTNKNYIYEEIAEIMNEEFEDNIFTDRSVALKWEKIGGDEIKKRNEKLEWTQEMEECLIELKSKKNPDTNKDYMYEEIAQIMNLEFEGKTFTDRNIAFKWNQIGKIKNTSIWTDKRIESLKKLKNKKKPGTKKTYTNQEIAELLNDEYDVNTFTASSVRQKWTRIAGKGSKKNIEWTEKMEKRLTDLKEGKNSPKKQSYSDQEIAQMMKKEFKDTRFTEEIIKSRLARIAKNKNKK